MSISVPSEYRSLLWLVRSLLFEVFIIIYDLISGALVLYWEYEDFTKKKHWKLAWNPWIGLETRQLRAHRYLA